MFPDPRWLVRHYSKNVVFIWLLRKWKWEIFLKYTGIIISHYCLPTFAKYAIEICSAPVIEDESLFNVCPRYVFIIIKIIIISTMYI